MLVSALHTALCRRSPTPELGRTARNWGARFSVPVEPVAALAALREVVHASMRLADATSASCVPGLVAAEKVEGTGERVDVPREILNDVMDHVMVEAVDAASTNLRTQARSDHLTGCANRLAFTEDLAHAAASAGRSGLDLAIAVVDLDGLKRVNDTAGHVAGDGALKALVALLRSELRDTDLLYRTGGDEFVVIAPFTDAAGAAAMLRRASGKGGPCFSWGIATMKEVGQAAVDDPEVLLAAADANLYARRGLMRRSAPAAAGARWSAAGAVVGEMTSVTPSNGGNAAAPQPGAGAPVQR